MRQVMAMGRNDDRDLFRFHFLLNVPQGSIAMQYNQTNRLICNSAHVIGELTNYHFRVTRLNTNQHTIIAVAAQSALDGDPVARTQDCADPSTTWSPYASS